MSALRVAVVGGGLVGLSITRALTARGITEVGVFERASLASGGTGKSSGIVRTHYGVPSVAALAWHSLPVFEALADEVGFRQVGYTVIVGEHNVEPLRANTAMHQDLGIDVDLIDTDRLRTLWPYLNVDDVALASFEPRGGSADASQLALHFGRAARDAGATIRQGVPVARIRVRDGDKIAGLELAGGECLDVDVVIVAAGWWSRALLAAVGLDVPLTSMRSELLVVDAGEPLPWLPVVSDLISLQYARVEGSGHLLVGNSDHRDPELVDPDGYSNRVSEAGLERAAEKLLHRFGAFPRPTVAHGYAGCYDLTPDWNPVISATPVKDLFLAAGFSGHGFKISPAVGDLMADLVLEGDSRLPTVPARDFRLSRFAEADPLLSPYPYAEAGEMR